MNINKKKSKSDNLDKTTKIKIKYITNQINKSEKLCLTLCIITIFWLIYYMIYTSAL